jgi:hypothetical protein
VAHATQALAARGGAQRRDALVEVDGGQLGPADDLPDEAAGLLRLPKQVDGLGLRPGTLDEHAGLDAGGGGAQLNEVVAAASGPSVIQG